MSFYLIFFFYFDLLNFSKSLFMEIHMRTLQFSWLVGIVNNEDNNIDSNKNSNCEIMSSLCSTFNLKHFDEFFFSLCFSGLFSDRILPCSLDWPQSHESSALASLVLELQACATKSLMMSFIFATVVGLDTLKGPLY